MFDGLLDWATGVPFLGTAISAVSDFFGGGSAPQPQQLGGPGFDPNAEANSGSFGFSSLPPGTIPAAIGATGQQMTNAQQIQLAQNQMDFQAGQTRQQMDFQERMSGSSYQRAVKDLGAAGLNPMLAYQRGGASQPTGSAASGAMATLQSPVGAAVNSASVGARLDAEVRKLDSETALNLAQIPKVEQEARTGTASAGQMVASTEKLTRELSQIDQQIKESEGRVFEMRSAARQSGSAADVNVYERFVLKPLEAKKLELENQLKRYELPGARREAEMRAGPWGAVSPYMADVVRSIGSAFGLKQLVTK